MTRVPVPPTSAESAPTADSATTAPSSPAAARLVLERVHVRSEARLDGPLAGASLALGAGVYAVLGRPADGTATLVDAVAGRLAVRSGRLTVDGRSPAADAAIRTRIGSLAASPALGPARTVAELVGMVRGWREPADPDPLELLGLGPLAALPIRALTRPQARAIELGLALAVIDAAVLVLYEPRSELWPVDVARLHALLRARADAGACVLVVTSSPRDAALLGADDVRVLSAGRIVGAPLPAGWGVATGQELVIWLDGARGGGARALAVALARRAEIGGVGWQQAAQPGLPELVAVRAPDLARAAVAVAEEATRTEAAVFLVQTADPGLDELARWAGETERIARLATAAPPGSAASSSAAPAAEREP